MTTRRERKRKQWHKELNKAGKTWILIILALFVLTFFSTCGTSKRSAPAPTPTVTAQYGE